MTTLSSGVGDFLGDRFFATGDLTRPTLAVAVALALVAVGIDPVWRKLRFMVTTVHEMGHVVVGWFVGRDVQSVRLHQDTSGLTVTRGRAHGPGLFFLYAAGYPAPSLVGFALLWAVIYRHAGWAAGLLLVLLLVCLLLVRNVFGALVVIIQIAAVAAIWVWNEPQALSALLTAVGAVLSLGGVRASLDVVASGRRRRSATSDAAILGRQTRLGERFWAYAFVAISIALVAVTALMLWGQSASLA